MKEALKSSMKSGGRETRAGRRSVGQTRSAKLSRIREKDWLDYAKYSRGSVEPVADWQKFGEAVSPRASCFPTAGFSRNEDRNDSL